MFRQAERTKTKARILVMGPSGSGKTRTALHIADALTDDPIVVINTETSGEGIGSSELYANHVPHMSGVIQYPYHPDDFVKYINQAVLSGAGAIIVDSASHEWEGALILLEELKKRSKNQLAPWGKITPLHDKFIQTVIHCPVHIIVTVRTEDKVGLDDNNKPIKIHDKIIQRKGDAFLYEFSLGISVDQGETSKIEKTRYDEFMPGDTFDVKDDEFYKMLVSAHDHGVEPPKTKMGFLSILARHGYTTNKEIRELQDEIPALDQKWTQEVHDEMVEAFESYISEE